MEREVREAIEVALAECRSGNSTALVVLHTFEAEHGPGALQRHFGVTSEELAPSLAKSPDAP